MTGDIRHLAGFIPEPTVQEAIMAFMEAAGEPKRLSEIAIGANITLQQASKATGRLHTQGRLQRDRFPMTGRSGTRTGAIHYHTRPMWVYRIPVERSE